MSISPAVTWRSAPDGLTLSATQRPERTRAELEHPQARRPRHHQGPDRRARPDRGLLRRKGKPMAASAQVRDPAFASRVVAETRALLATVRMDALTQPRPAHKEPGMPGVRG